MNGVTDILQPDFSGIWADLDETTRQAIFPHVNGEAREQLLAISRQVFDETARAKVIAEKAAENLLWRDVKKEADRLDAERLGAGDSWAAQDIASLFDTDQQKPEIGCFADGDGAERGVFYRGKVNEVHGPSESGKTMFVLAVAAQEIIAERHVAMVDYEDDGRAIVNRLRYVFGMQREQIEKYFHYFRPDTPFGEAGLSNITGIGEVSMCIIDAVTESMSVSGLDGRNENEVATWYNEFPKKLATAGMGVIIIDHTPQDNHQRQIGSQHKKSAIDGVSYTAEPVHPFVKGQLGGLRLRVAKDKIGSIRSAALPGGEGKQYWRGDFRIDGRQTPDSPRLELTGVDAHGTPSGDQGKAHDVKSVELPPEYLTPTMMVLADDGAWLSAQAIGKTMGLGMSKKDASRAQPRTYCNRLMKLSPPLVERRESGTAVHYRITEAGKHAANAWANKIVKDAQEALEIDVAPDVSPPPGATSKVQRGETNGETTSDLVQRQVQRR